MEISMDEISAVISQQTLKIFMLEKQIGQLQAQLQEQLKGVEKPVDRAGENS